MSGPVFLQASNLAQLEGVDHAFFTRHGGVSQGIYKSLNCGIGSDDDQGRVRQNRAFVAGVMRVAADQLLTLYQKHTTDCVVVDGPFPEKPPYADAMVTNTPNLALGISTADCTPILLADVQARVIGAVHAGWRGAVAGIIGMTIEKMRSLGAKTENIAAAIGPVIRQQSYEVGQDVITACIARNKDNEQFFKPALRPDHAMFDLPGLVAAELKRAGLSNIEDLKRDTYGDESLFFSYRRMTHRKEADYGRHLHAIVLEA